VGPSASASDGRGRPRRAPWVHAAVALAYLLLALSALRVAVLAPTPALPYRALHEGRNTAPLVHTDQQFVVWGVARNARTLLARPSALHDAEQCHPTPRATTLGEHMFGAGLLAVVPWALTREPITTYDVVLVLSLWLAALAMYALVLHWTGSVPAALVAGLLFGFHPARLGDPEHPYVHANQWTPLALLFAHRLVVGRRWRDAAGLAAACSLQLLESYYQVVALAVLGGAVAVVLAVRHRRRLPLGRLAAAAGAVAGTCALVMVPYLDTRRTWGVLQDAPPILPPPQAFGPGGGAFPGAVLLALAVLGLADRARRGRGPGEPDPRLPLLLGAVLLAWTSTWGVTLLGGRLFLPTPAMMLREWVPGFSAGRGVAHVRDGVYLALAFSAGFGVHLLTARLRAAARAAVTAGVAAAALAELFVPAIAARSFGDSLELRAWEPRPAAADLDLLRTAAAGAVLDLPLDFGLQGRLRLNGHYLLLGAYHRRPVAACINSFRLPIVADVERLAGRLPEPAAVAALAALGFRTVVLHLDMLHPAARAVWRARIVGGLVGAGRGTVAGETPAHVVVRLREPGPIDAGLAALAVPGPAAAEPPARLADGGLEFRFRNAGAITWRHPAPIVPTRLVVTWRSLDGRSAALREVSLLLPLALAPGDAGSRRVPLAPPREPGDYEVTLGPADRPALVLARRRVRVPAGQPPAPVSAR
jgi:hypothetical protein